MIEEKEKIKSSQDVDFLRIVEDQKPSNDENLEDSLSYVFFCKDCKDVAEVASSVFRWKNIFKCKNCSSEKIVSWSEESLKKYFRVK